MSGGYINTLLALAGDPMRPFPYRNEDGMFDDRIGKEYFYEASPFDEPCNTHEQCSPSGLLWCDTSSVSTGECKARYLYHHRHIYSGYHTTMSGSVAKWLACWTQAQKGPGSNRSRATLSGNSLRQTVHTHCAFVHQAAKLVEAVLRAAG